MDFDIGCAGMISNLPGLGGRRGVGLAAKHTHGEHPVDMRVNAVGYDQYTESVFEDVRQGAQSDGSAQPLPVASQLNDWGWLDAFETDHIH